MKRADAWWLTLDGRPYGPYGITRLRSFADEGRLIGASLVGRAANGPFRSASEASELADLFVTREPRTLLVCLALFSAQAQQRVASVIAPLGAALQPFTGLWLLRTTLPAATVRNLLSRDLTAGDRFIVAEATPGRLTWFGLDGDVDHAIRTLVTANSPTPSEAAE